LPAQSDVASADTHTRNPARYGLSAFSDDFSAGGLDMAKWSLLQNNGVPVSDGATLGDGQAEITRVLRSKQTFTDAFGHAEARIKVERRNGVWRAFSLLDADGRVPQGTIETIDGGIDPTSGRNFHTYALDWSPQEVVWSVDGKPSLRLNRQDDGGPLTLVLNLASDGDSAGRMEVDFVQVFTSPTGPPTATPSPSDSSDPTPSDPAPSDSSDPTPSDPIPSDEPTATPTASDEPTVPPPTSSSPTPSEEPTQTATAWATFTKYAVGDLVTYDGITYRVLEAHTSLPGWEPPKLPDLFEKV